MPSFACRKNEGYMLGLSEPLAHTQLFTYVVVSSVGIGISIVALVNCWHRLNTNI